MGVGAGMNSAPRAVFLDRDGVLNRAVVRDGKPYPPASVAELEIVEGAAAGMARLKNLRFLLFVVTNQPDIARGKQTLDEIHAMHTTLRQTLPIDEFFICPHDDRDGCQCRKPAPGLMFEARERYGIDLSRSFLIGDRWRDIDAGRVAGCRTVWIDCRYHERAPSAAPDARVLSLSEAVDWIVRNSEGNDDCGHQ